MAVAFVSAQTVVLVEIPMGYWSMKTVSKNPILRALGVEGVRALTATVWKRLTDLWSLSSGGYLISRVRGSGPWRLRWLV